MATKKQKGKAYLNYKSLPDKNLVIYYLRIGLPLSMDSRLKVLGKTTYKPSS